MSEINLDELKKTIADLEQKKRDAVESFPAIVSQRLALTEQKYLEIIAKEKIAIAKEYLQRQKEIEADYQLRKKLANISIAAIEVRKLEAGL